jgi:hypothetical protein
MRFLFKIIYLVFKQYNSLKFIYLVFKQYNSLKFIYLNMVKTLNFFLKIIKC